MAIPLAGLTAMALAGISALFGAVIARTIWADDLHHAKRIDELRSQTEKHLRGQIEIMERRLGDRK